MNKSTSCLLALLIATSGVPLAQEALPFSLPVPDGWQTETIPFPLEFAPQIPYSGLEELRFSPGMFEEGADDFWTYAFVWWVNPDDPTDAQALSGHLETYFRGLATAVAESRSIDASQARFSASIAAGPVFANATPARARIPPPTIAPTPTPVAPNKPILRSLSMLVFIQPRI